MKKVVLLTILAGFLTACGGPPPTPYSTHAPCPTSSSSSSISSPPPSPTIPVDMILQSQREMYEATVDRMESNFSLLLGVATIVGGAVAFLSLAVALAGIPWIRRQIRTGIEEAVRERTEEELSKSIDDLISELRREYEPKIVELLSEYEKPLKRKK